ncbi:MAG: UDP-2,4-diacetamido-2,4,6-trideoxy-beta-L-altropyranose hydrolase [bacterium]|nr:MAG: UDP-2,4-diacetamido-2,4,6-trideoxy-beta-L-altropyranose hydrolase [bacterium]
MKLFFRTDASSQIGTGHVMRCLTLADELQEKNGRISFICCEEKGHLFEQIKKRGYKVHTLPPGIDIHTDSSLTEKILKQEQTNDWLVIDHYGIGSLWESAQRKYVNKIMVIDDLADRKHDCDLLLDQNITHQKDLYHSLVSEKCSLLLGPKYALLRKQFFLARQKLRVKSQTVKRILLFLGGSDPDNITAKVLKAIHGLKQNDLTIDVVIGATNPHHDDIKHLVNDTSNIYLHVQVENMAEWMVRADLSIGAGGSASWERCCLGLPTITIILAENQRDIAEQLAEKEIIVNLGWYNRVTENDIKHAIIDLMRDWSKRKMMSQKGMELLDGRGVTLVVEKMFDLISSH